MKKKIENDGCKKNLNNKQQIKRHEKI